MTHAVTVRPRARLDLLEQFVYFGERAGIGVAERYLAAVNDTCFRLASHPETGRLYDCGIAHLEGLRRAAVKGFETYLIFYMTVSSGIDIIRVLHGARDIATIFAADEA